MSHFSVLVVGEDPDGQLAPFQENNMGDCPEEYLEWYDTYAEERGTYENGNTTMVLMPDGTETHEYLAKRCDDYRDDLPRKEVRFTELYPEYTDYLKDWCGYVIESDGRCGYYYNPDAKWDWYTLGGRWVGYFKLVENPKWPHTLGEHYSVDPEEIKRLKGRADQCYKGDVDLAAMYKEAAERATSRYEAVCEVVKKHGIPPRWKDVREAHSNIDEARDEWNEHPAVRALMGADLMPFFDDVWDLYHFELGIGEKALQACIEDAKCNTIVPFAVLIDGEWHEKGEMGWFGMVRDEKLTYDWSTQFFSMFEQLPDDTMLSIIDCHI